MIAAKKAPSPDLIDQLLAGCQNPKDLIGKLPIAIRVTGRADSVHRWMVSIKPAGLRLIERSTYL